jgi:hypothetical protein
MTRTFGIVDYKVKEAEFFLEEIKRHGKKLDFFAVQYTTGAFASAARSITLAMQASLKGNQQFEAWYKKKQDALRNDALAKFFIGFRNVTQHIGENVVAGGSYNKDGVLYKFVASPDLPNVPEQDVITACNEYFKIILELVYHCYLDLGPIIDGQQRYTKEYYSSLGKTIEDAEEDLGFPRGWTDTGNEEFEPYRWEWLRAQADGCLIEEQFNTWLELSLPYPEPLPAYKPSK